MVQQALVEDMRMHIVISETVCHYLDLNQTGILDILQQAEAKAAAAQERERAVNERVTQTLSRMAVMEAQVPGQILDFALSTKDVG